MRGRDPAHGNQRVERLGHEDVQEVVDVFWDITEHRRVECRHMPPDAVLGEMPPHAVDQDFVGKVLGSLFGWALRQAGHLRDVGEDLPL